MWTYTREDLMAYSQQITPVDDKRRKQMEQKIDGLTKPVGALGALEEMMIQLSGIYEADKIELDLPVTVIMCADNGVCEEGVSSCPQEVTTTVTYNFTRGITGVNKISEFTKSAIHIVDIGVKNTINEDRIINRKVMKGTRNMTQAPAMTHNEAIQAIFVGIEETEKLIEKGYTLFGTGEMGIGNTTTSAAVLVVLLDKPVEVMAGKGAGVKDLVYASKIKAIKQAIAKHQPNKEDPIDVLSKVGGLDIAGLVGVYLACAKHKKAVVIDGFIASAAAVVAAQIAPLTKTYMIASHLSEEAGMTYALEALEKEAYLNLKMRLGEGSGCPILFHLLQLAQYTLEGMGTFEEAHIDAADYQNIWK